MTTTVGGIRVRILGDDSDLQKKLGDSAKQLAKYGAAAAAAGAAAATALTVQGLKAVDAQAKLARSLDTTIDSLKAMQMAAGDAGIDGLEGSLARLNRRLGAAERGSGAAAHAVEALGLDLQALSGMDVDERMATIADAIRDSGASMQVAARHAQDLGFEQREAAAFFMQGGDAIRAYRGEVEALGLSMSEIDAAKVEAANDAFGAFGDQMEVISQTLAIQVAPLITAVSNMFEEAAKEAGGFGEATSDAFGYVVDAAAFVMDAVDGIKRVFELVADGVIAVWGTMTGFVLDKIETIVEVLDKLPGIDMSDQLESIRAFASQTESVVASAVANMNDTLMAPMAGSKFKAFVAQAKDEAQKAAEEIAAQGLEIPQLGGGRGGEEGDEEEAEKHRAKIEERLERIREANMSELELLQLKFEQENAVIDEAFANRILTEEEWLALSRDQKSRHEDELTEIEKRAADARQRVAEQEAQAKQRILSGAMSALTTLMNSESRKLFEIGKVAAISQSIISTYQGASEALKLGWPLGPIAAAAITTAGFANVAAIKSQSFGGGGASGGGGVGSVTQNVNAQAEAVQPREQTVANISLQGDTFGRETVKSLMEQMNELADDGMRFNVV